MSAVSLCPNCRAFLSESFCACGFVNVPVLITLEQYFKGPAPSAELQSNAENLLLKVNSLLQALNCQKVTVTSGYRSPEHNKAIGGAAASRHCLAQAIDLADNDRRLGDTLMLHQDLLKKRDMAMEALPYCVKLSGNKWVHLQSVLPASKRTVFIPYSGAIRLT